MSECCTSPPLTPKLNAALLKARRSMGQPKKNKTVRTGTYSFNFADLDEIVRVSQPALTDNGIVLQQNLTTTVTPEYSLAQAQTILRHESGEVWQSSWFGVPSKDFSPQGIGGAATYAKRYSMCAALGIVADEDDDASPGASVTSRPAAPAAAPSARPSSPGAAIMAQAEGFDRAANKAAIFKALAEHGITDTGLRAKVMQEAEATLGKPYAQFTQAECMRFLEGARKGAFNWVLTPADNDGSSDQPESPLPV